MKKTKIIRNVLAVSGILAVFLPFGAFAGPQLPTNFVRPALKAPQASDLVITSLQNQIALLQKQNAVLRTQLKVEQCPDQVDECTRNCYADTDVCGEGGGEDGIDDKTMCVETCRTTNSFLNKDSVRNQRSVW